MNRSQALVKAIQQKLSIARTSVARRLYDFVNKRGKFSKGACASYCRWGLLEVRTSPHGIDDWFEIYILSLRAYSSTSSHDTITTRNLLHNTIKRPSS